MLFYSGFALALCPGMTLLFLFLTVVLVMNRVLHAQCAHHAEFLYVGLHGHCFLPWTLPWS